MRIASSVLTAVLAALALSACASDTTNYPSLARRAVERANGAAPPAPAPVPLPPTPELTARLASLINQAREAHGRFQARRSYAERSASAGSGAARGSEGWAVASIALAELESARSAAMIALADLDQLYAAARVDGSDSTTIAAARDEVSVWIGDEDRVLAGLRGRLGS